MSLRGLGPNSRGAAPRRRSSPAPRAVRGTRLAAHPVVCASIHLSIIFLWVGVDTGSLSCSPHAAWRAPSLGRGDLAAMGTAPATENPSIPALLCGGLVPGQGSPQPTSPAGRTEPTAAPREEPGTPDPAPVAGMAEVSHRAEKPRCQRSSAASRGAGGSREEPAASFPAGAGAPLPRSRRSESEPPTVPAPYPFPFSSDQICRILASCRLLGSKQGLVTRLDEQPGRPRREAAARL